MQLCVYHGIQQRHVLASGSADKTVKLWDTTTSSCLMTMKHHNDKVQAAMWHPLEQTVLATGAFDKNIAVLDVRQIELGSKCTVTSDIESINGIHTILHNLPLVVKMVQYTFMMLGILRLQFSLYKHMKVHVHQLHLVQWCLVLWAPYQ